jgi:hypothetical protein
VRPQGFGLSGGRLRNETRTGGLLRGAQHRGNSGRGVWLATWVTEAIFGQFGGNLPERIWPSIGVVPEPPCQIDHLRVPLGVAFTAAALLPSGFFAITSRLELGDCGGLVELGNAPSTWRTRTAVGVSLMKKSGAVAGTSVTPSFRRWSCPASCTDRSRAKRSGLSTRSYGRRCRRCVVLRQGCMGCRFDYRASRLRRHVRRASTRLRPIHAHKPTFRITAFRVNLPN